MTIVSFATTKGGSGKSLLTRLVGTEMAVHGARAKILCVDPQHTTWQWSQAARRKGTLPDNLTVERIDEDAVFKQRLTDPGDVDITLIDVQGAYSQALNFAIAASDLCIVPCRATMDDAREVVRIFEYAASLKRAKLMVVINAISGIDRATQAFKEAVGELVRHKLPLFKTPIMQRPIYAEFAHEGGTLESLASTPDRVEQVKKARDNIARLLDEIYEHAGVLVDG
ncbi:chromosome partitioning protein ParA [Labrys miyagiensis]|uniref:Chromosome partitioning protein ParA n=1 Tax=Labrys miyagiensis TaxID=346912 RepID=A0ABQ6CN14_9HYPH|nr:ParA family protein [Labrys miyagiensis]GLS20114.1 chromosome partitioning protein ParA [Labrys miyagiensis]